MTMRTGCPFGRVAKNKSLQSYDAVPLSTTALQFSSECFFTFVVSIMDFVDSLLKIAKLPVLPL